ncbi:biotin--[acetyl-CoA-carboxylase] ligase [Maribacter sp. 2307UL18-2]|uniref:biotin--[acetyl-CoA-carboxylase] ligase n=1 Tax=Maribacter sp. 2307UL18-2 TaxID=3386274 RepID=UPI0039BC92E9
MHIIKLDATDSTNSYLKNLIRQHSLVDFTSVMTDQQLNGKGQMGASWESEPGKNLTFSTLKKFDMLEVSDAFLLSICASLAVADVLKQFAIPDVHVKWPNDILSGRNKICGILVENLLLGKRINTSIFGIGLNVNQTVFHTVSNATSMKLLLGTTFNLDDVHSLIVHELKKHLANMVAGKSSVLRIRYEQQLFRKNRPSTFKGPDGNSFVGIIRGVSEAGKLRIEQDNEAIREYGLKQVKLLY